MDPLLSLLSNLPSPLAPLVETSLIALSLFLVATPIAAWMGWVLVTRRLSTLIKWIAWGAVWSALFTPSRLLAEGMPLHWLPILDGRLALWLALLFVVISVSLLFAVRLFAVTAAVGRVQRYQMGLTKEIAPALVVRPLLRTLMVWGLGVSFLVVVFDFGVAERVGVETLSVALYTLDQPLMAQLLQWGGLLLFSLLLMLRAYKRLPAVDWEQVDAERVPVKVGTYLLILLISLLYTPLGITLGQFVHG